MTTKVHGGMPTSYQNLTGRLVFLKLTCTGATFTTGDAYVVGSDLDVVLTTLATRGTVVIANASGPTILNVAIENNGSWDIEGDGSYTALEAAIVAASTAVSGNISAAAVVGGAFTVA